jgi:serine/threonine-protein kinase HipA
MKTRSQAISNIPKPVYVWIYLPGETKPVVAGVVMTKSDRSGASSHSFRYAQSYIARSNAISIFTPELPLTAGQIDPPGIPAPNAPLMAGCLRDAMPDAWGRRVIVNRLTGAKQDNIHVDTFDEPTYMLQSGSDRIGALDFQESPTDYVARNPRGADIEALIEAAHLVEAGKQLPTHLDNAMFHGNSIGGARPKAMTEIDNRKYLLKFPSASDVFPIIKGEYVAMRLASLCGIDTANVSMINVGKQSVLAIERFDRVFLGPRKWERKAIVSALTVLGLDEMTSRYASYKDFADTLRRLGRIESSEPMTEIFSRISFNILCGNTDDHARNHAAFWDGKHLTMTPAYDLCPQARTGRTASQAMMINNEDRSSRLVTCLNAAPSFGLRHHEAADLIENQINIIQSHYRHICDEAELGAVDRQSMWENQFMNPFAFDDWPRSVQMSELDDMIVSPGPR